MSEISPALLQQIRDQFAQVDHCEQQGERAFFENAGGALTLNSVVECSREYAAIPDNQGRDNPGSKHLVEVIKQARQDMTEFMNAPGGQFFVGESGTELLFRLISNACLGCAPGGVVLGSSLEHPATRSACQRWSKIAGHTHTLLNHNNDTGTIDAALYAGGITSNTRVATIIHTSPVTGMGADVAAIAKAIRAVSPDCFIIVDGIQHAAHGSIDLASYDIDGYVISAYKVFSRHGYGVAWISDRLTALPHDSLVDGPEGNWELGTRDTGSYATFSKVIHYFDWLGSQLSNDKVPKQAADTGETSRVSSRRKRFQAAATAINAHEKVLTDAMLNGVGNLMGLTSMAGIHILGGAVNPAREGLVSFWVDDISSADVVEHLNEQGVRTHVRKADHYSGSILKPLNLDSCIRVSVCHYNSLEEVNRFLHAMNQLMEQRDKRR